MVVGLVGCGRWGVHILRDLRALGCDVPVVARSDESVARAREGGASAVVADVSAADATSTGSSSHHRRARTPRSWRPRSSTACPSSSRSRSAPTRRRPTGLSELGARAALRDGQVALPPRRPRAGRDRPFGAARPGASGSRRRGSAGDSRTTTSTARGSWHPTTWRSRSRSSAGCRSRCARSVSPRGMPSCTSRRRSTAGPRGTRSSCRPGRPSIVGSVELHCDGRHRRRSQAAGTHTSRSSARERRTRRRAGRDAR